MPGVPENSPAWNSKDFFHTEQSASEILGRRISELRWVARKQAHLDIPVVPLISLPSFLTPLVCCVLLASFRTISPGSAIRRFFRWAKQGFCLPTTTHWSRKQLSGFWNLNLMLSLLSRTAARLFVKPLL